MVTSRQEVLSNSVDEMPLPRRSWHNHYPARSGCCSKRSNTALHSVPWYRCVCPGMQFAATLSSVEALTLSLITGVRIKKRVIPLGPVVDALGAAKTEALPGLHAFSEAGWFAGKGKLTCWQPLSSCSMEVILAFAPLGTSEELRVDTECAIETFFASSVTLVPLCWMLVISGGSFSLRNN